MRKSAGKGKIREALRKIFDEAGDNPLNMNRAWQLLRLQMLPDASRSRVREVLREPEFTPRRPRPGRKAKRSPKPAAVAARDIPATI